MIESNNNWVIRYAVVADLDGVKKLADSNKRELGFLLRPALAKSIRQRELLIAEKDDAILGFIQFHHRRDNQTTLYNVVVRAQTRRHGIGSELINALVNDAEVHGKHYLLLKCPEELPANDFYRNTGWLRVDIESGKHRRLNIWRFNIIEN